VHNCECDGTSAHGRNWRLQYHACEIDGKGISCTCPKYPFVSAAHHWAGSLALRFLASYVYLGYCMHICPLVRCRRHEYIALYLAAARAKTEESFPRKRIFIVLHLSYPIIPSWGSHALYGRFLDGEISAFAWVAVPVPGTCAAFHSALYVSLAGPPPAALSLALSGSGCKQELCVALSGSSQSNPGQYQGIRYTTLRYWWASFTITVCLVFVW
jgi:hypothetical protein